MISHNHIQSARKFGVVVLLLFAHQLSAQDVWDSDGDGIDDNSDNCTLTFNPAQNDTDGDFFGNLCDADFNNDNIIDDSDLSLLRTNFFSVDPLTDINVDNVTNVIDLGWLKTMYLQDPGPTATNPDQPPCNCYFSGDCPSGMFCNWGPGGFSTEDICAYRDIKPNGVPDAGCSIEWDDPFLLGICDGFCSPSSDGSVIGLEDPDLVAQSIAIWGDAMMNPSEAGGGPVDGDLADAAQAVPFTSDAIPMMLGRHAADALAMASGDAFHDYFCHWEGHPDDGNPPVVDLSGDTCRITAGRLTIKALIAEIRSPGSAPDFMNSIPDVCPNWQEMFSTQCPSGPEALNCAIGFIQAQAYYLTTPTVFSLETADILELLESQAQ